MISEEGVKRQIRESDLRGGALFSGFGGYTRQIVAGTRGRGFGEERFQILEMMNDVADGAAVAQLKTSLADNIGQGCGC